MSDKPLEWVHHQSQIDAVECYVADCPDSDAEYCVWPDGTAWWTNYGHWQDVPGPYDGTIETAKQRCEEHRRKVSQ